MNQTREQGKSCNAFSDLISEVIIISPHSVHQIQLTFKGGRIRTYLLREEWQRICEHLINTTGGINPQGLLEHLLCAQKLGAWVSSLEVIFQAEEKNHNQHLPSIPPHSLPSSCLVCFLACRLLLPSDNYISKETSLSIFSNRRS